MSRPIEPALFSLLPEHNPATPFPQPLTELASNLLAQSGSRKSTFKAHELVAIPYACAHLACERLKGSLDLPPIHERPPIKPKEYTRLYKYLENLLPAASTSGRTSSQLGTPSRTHHELGSSPGGRSLPSRLTPNRAKSLAQFRATPTGSRTPSKTGRSTSKSTDKLPLWVKPTLRHLSRTLGDKSIASPLVAGIQHILHAKGERMTDDWVHENMVSLLGGLYMLVWKHGHRSSPMPDARYDEVRNALFDALKDSRKTIVGDGNFWKAWHHVDRVEDIDDATDKISRSGWFRGDWLESIDAGLQAETDGGNRTKGTKSDHGDTESSGHVQIRHRDTMFQDRYDYLSDRKRQEYAAWKATILARIEAMEGMEKRQVTGGDAMIVDS